METTIHMLFSEGPLYNFLGPIINDEVERFLFGNVDKAGSEVVRAS